MKTQVLLRKIHHWGSLIIMVQLGLIIGAGLLLTVKKEFEWIQPFSQVGQNRDGVPVQTMEELFEVVRGIDELEVEEWSDLSRVDFKPGKGIVKFVSPTNWEAQLDTETGGVLQLAYRRSDWIESLHDGSYFGDWVKLYVFLPTGVILLFLWGTGIYLFFLPHYKRMMRRRKREAPRQ